MRTAIIFVAASLTLVASAASVGMLVLTGQWRLAGLFLLLTLSLYMRHAANIGRLARGEEARIGERTV